MERGSEGEAKPAACNSICAYGLHSFPVSLQMLYGSLQLGTFTQLGLATQVHAPPAVPPPPLPPAAGHCGLNSWGTQSAVINVVPSQRSWQTAGAPLDSPPVVVVVSPAGAPPCWPPVEV